MINFEFSTDMSLLWGDPNFKLSIKKDDVGLSRIKSNNFLLGVKQIEKFLKD